MEWSDTDLAHLLASARLYGFWGSLTEGLRTGLLQNEAKGGGQNMFEVIYSDRVKLAQFARAMSAISADTARAIAAKFHWQEHRSVIDIGCAEGAVPVQIARAHEHITGAGSDLPALESIFDAYVARFGLGQRLGFTAGDFFTDPPPHADVLVMGHILHDWGNDDKLMLLRAAREALPDGGALIVYDAIIDDDRRENVFGLLMSLNMLIETPGGFDYTAADCMQWMHSVGFTSTRAEHLVGPDSMVVAIK